MFRVKNFTSFHNEIVLDMRATNYTEHPSHVMEGKRNGLKLLKTIAVYGANASGKSNLISALSWFERYIFNQLFNELWDENQISKESDSTGNLRIEPFLLVKDTDSEIEFEMIFSHDNTLFQYGFSISGPIIRNEWLLVNNESLFERSYKQPIQFGKKYKSQLRDLEKYREDRLYLSVLDFFATGIVKESIDCFKSFFQDRFNVFFELFLEPTIKGTVGMMGISKELVENESFRNKVAEYIRRIDVGIIDLIVEEERVQTRKGDTQVIPTIKTVHEVYDHEGKPIGTTVFNLSRESTGTLRFLSFIQSILLLLENGGVFIIDELSARLHPLLTKFIVDMFQSTANTNNAQLIFTTHDTSILNKDQFRRDEILFVDKNRKGESVLYSLADIKSVRKDATYNKDYFNGKYGAIPIFNETGENFRRWS